MMGEDHDASLDPAACAFFREALAPAAAMSGRDTHVVRTLCNVTNGVHLPRAVSARSFPGKAVRGACAVGLQHHALQEGVRRPPPPPLALCLRRRVRARGPGHARARASPGSTPARAASDGASARARTGGRVGTAHGPVGGCAEARALGTRLPAAEAAPPIRQRARDPRRTRAALPAPRTD